MNMKLLTRRSRGQRKESEGGRVKFRRTQGFIIVAVVINCFQSSGFISQWYLSEKLIMFHSYDANLIIAILFGLC